MICALSKGVLAESDEENLVVFLGAVRLEKQSIKCVVVQITSESSSSNSSFILPPDNES